MLRRVVLAATLLLATATTAQRPIFEPDDFVDPDMFEGTLFLSRLAAGGVSNPADRFRPLGGDAGLVVFTNSLYVDRFQFDYKHTEFIGVDDPGPLQRCDCPDPVYFPTPPPANATPDGPAAERSETLQLAFCRRSGADTPVTLRYRLSWSRRELDTTVVSATTGRTVEQRSGHDQSFMLDADTHLSFRGRNLWGSLYFARTSRSGTTDDRAQNEFAYVARPPGWDAGPLRFRTKLTLGAISGRGADGLNLINPYFETFWRHHKTGISVHAVWSGEWTRSGVEGWTANHQVAVFADYTLYAKILDW